MTRFEKTYASDRNDKRPKLRYGKTMVWLVLIVCFVSALVVYLLEVNAIASKGYQIREFQKQVDKVKEENEKLSLKVIELSSMSELDSKVQELNMVSIDAVTYYDNTGQVVARR